MTLGKLAPILTLLTITIACAGKSTINNNPNIIIPETPSELRAKALSSSEIHLDWRDNSVNEDFFAIYRFDRDQAQFSLIGRAIANVEIYSDIDVEDSTEYLYYVVSEKGDTSSDRSNPASATTFVTGMSYVGGINGHFPEGKLVLGNGTVFLGTSDSAITSINILFPQNPIIDERHRVPGEIRSISKAGDVLCLALGLGGMMLVSTYDPVHLETLGRCYTPGVTSNAVANDNYAYAVDITGLNIIDATDTRDPQLVGTFVNPSIATVNALYSEVNYIYLACGDSGLQVLNILDRPHPVWVGQLDTPGNANDLVKRGNYIFLADGIDGMKIIDVLYPNNPLLIATYHTSGEVTAVAVDNNFVYLSDSRSGLIIIDISFITAPRYAAMYKGSGQITGVRAKDGYIYLAVENDGLLILQYNP